MHGSATLVTVSPESSTLTAGSTQAFTTTAFDSFGNSWDSTASASFNIDSQARGSLSGNVYTSCNSGTWIVTARCFGLTDIASLTVTHSSPVNIEVGPNSASITAGSSQAYTATASDAYGNIWDVTDTTTWSVNSTAGGAWFNNHYTSESAGGWVIIGNCSGLSSFAYLTVNHASTINITISPSSAIMTSGSNEAFAATAYDEYGNQWDVSNSANWTASTDADGLWTGSTYTSANTGNWTVTANYGGLFDTASLTVNHGAALSITISPGSTSITAGQSQTFKATASDYSGNNWDVTNSTTWSIDPDAGGSWSSNIYASDSAGTWAVTGTYLGTSSSATITVNAGPAVSIAIGPSSSFIIAGNSQAFTASASDSYGNTWVVTSSTAWTIDDGAGGNWLENTYTSELSGTWSVTGTFSDLSATVFLTVNHSTAANIQDNPYNASITAGKTEIYTSTAFDVFGNSWDVTNLAVWTVDSNAGGFWSGNVYTAAQAGTWVITATVDNMSATAALTVTDGAPSSIVISPTSLTMESGSNQTFSATANDQYGNSWDASNIMVWSIDSAAGGSWSSNVYTAGEAGTWTLTGTLGNLTETATLTVNPGPLFSIMISPANATVNAGSSIVYTAMASDAYGNSWNITNSVNWLINAGAGGNWTENNCTISDVGVWIVTSSSAGVTGSAQITVNGVTQPFPSWLDLNHDGAVNFQDFACFLQAYLNYGSTGACNPACDLNHDGKINFQDLVIFISAYITYAESP